MSAFRTNPALRRRVAAVILAAIAAGWFSGTVQGAPEEEALLTVKGAQHFSLHRQSAASKQISYTMDLAYPARAIGEAQWEQLKKTGWTRCRYIDAVRRRQMPTGSDSRARAHHPSAPDQPGSG